MRLRAVKQNVARFRRSREFRSAVDELVQTAPNLPSRELLARLVWSWSNTAAGDVDYLLDAAKFGSSSSGPILECGSGLTTFLLAIYANHPVVTLENNEAWLHRVARALDRLPAGGVQLVHAPLRDFDGFAWYSIPDGVLLPDSFSLVVCDGPPRAGKPGGRVGLLPVMNDRLPPGTVMLLDLHMRNDEAAAVDTWRTEYGFVDVESESSTTVLQRG
jgi:hypothetical protein